ncbi:type VII secretion protein EccCa [Serinibacter arcticus]|uniref:type VII secretion protein EccCa n=1 Tax=Serinibacter arcticus TaxID=1655435 RepID=UPI001092C2A3|nr:type VII secretion protein EccCa [Serinibacter arcticus]
MSVETGRVEAPPVPTGTIELQAPPDLVKAEGGSSTAMTIMPVMGSVGSIAVITLGATGGGGVSTTRILMGGAILVASLGFVIVNLMRQRSMHRSAVTGARREYLSYLAGLREDVRAAAGRQRLNAEWHMPSPPALAVVAEEGTRVWERRVGDPDLLHVRIGTAQAPLSVTIEEAEPEPNAQPDPVAASAAHRFVTTHSVQTDLPTRLDLMSTSRVEIAGDGDASRALARAVLCHLATFTSPADVRIAVVASPENLPAWEWVKWLPHAWSPTRTDGAGHVRVIGSDAAEVLVLLPLGERGPFSLAAEQALPHVVLVTDGVALPATHALAREGGLQGVTVLDLPQQWGDVADVHHTRLLLQPTAGGGPSRLSVVRYGVDPRIGEADALSIAGAEAAARRLVRGGLPTEEESGPRTVTSAELVDLLGLGDVRDFSVAQGWRPRSKRDRLRVPIGMTTQGAPIHLDIKESAEEGMGPHGLIIGATGSGKSEVLRTLVLALAMTHSSEDLNFVLVDFKGGATFAGMADMPHVSAIITNLGEELALVDRMQDALQGEMTRRQELLRSAGNFTNVSEYTKARKEGRTDLPPLPALLIVCDEFSELLSAKPEFTDLFVAIGRLGRSLQMHLLLSSQRLEEGRLRGLESHLSYRIGLRTFSSAESRTVLGVPDAYTLPSVPGIGYLKPDTTSLIQFRAAYVSGPPPRRRRRRRRSSGDVRLTPFTAAPVQAQRVVEVEQEDAPDPEAGRATFDIAVRRMKDQGPEAHQVWLPPLEVPLTFDQLAPDLVVEPGRGLHSPGWRAAGDMVVPLGLVDRPLEQRRETLTISLAGAGGHVGVVGAPRSGKSTMLRSIVTGVALTHTPLEAQFYVLDFGGGTFTPFRDLPHVASVAGRSEPDVVRRTVAEVTAIVNAREKYFRDKGIDTVETYRSRRTPGDPTGIDDGYGDVFLVIDGWTTLRSEFDDIEPLIQALAGRGLTFGLHVMLASGRWMDLRSQMKDVVGTRLELRLGDSLDSEVDRKVAQTVPANRPGRGLMPSKHHMLGALPRIDGDPRPGTLGDGVGDLVQTIASAWDGPAGPKLRLLPELISLDEVRADAGAEDPRLLLGVDEAALAPLGLDPTDEPHVLLLGDSGAGKTSFLRGLVHEVMRTRTPKEAQFVVLDYRRALLGEIPDSYLNGYYTGHEQATGSLQGLVQFLRTRMPGPDVTPAQLRARSWWKGPDVFVLVDDYDLVATSAGNPLLALAPLFAQAGDVGLHLAVTRRVGGASRALYDPVLQPLKDLAVPTILLSGSPDEGALLGRIKARIGVPGRAQVITREAGVQVAQLAYVPPVQL